MKFKTEKPVEKKVIKQKAGFFFFCKEKKINRTLAKVTNEKKVKTEITNI